MECTLFHHSVIINKLYESSNPNIEEVVNDPEQHDRIVTKKDVMSASQWQYDENKHELYTDKKFKAALGANGSDYIFSAGVKSETKYKTFDIQKMSDVLDIAWIEQDKSSEDEKWVICSRSSGIWMGTFDENEHIVLSVGKARRRQELPDAVGVVYYLNPHVRRRQRDAPCVRD